MKSKYQIGDLILLRKEPHIGTTYPTELKEAVEKGEPVEISGADGLYKVKVKDFTYSIFDDEIVGFYRPTTLFI